MHSDFYAKLIGAEIFCFTPFNIFDSGQEINTGNEFDCT